MATISLNDTGKAVGENIRFVLAAAEFDLEGSGTYETDDRAIIADASIHPYLQVSYDEVGTTDATREEIVAIENSSDPFVNPRADHLRAEADPEVVEAARQEAERVRRIAAGEVDTPPVPATPQTPLRRQVAPPAQTFDSTLSGDNEQ